MTKYHIQGGKPLRGSITISGAKNAAVAIIPAALLVDGVCRIENIPQISDVTLILQILQELGADIRTVNRTTVDIDCSHIRNRQVPYELARKIRASYYLVGALLGRFGWAEVPLPGGCDLGGRPIDQHVKGFVSMGADVDVRAIDVKFVSSAGEIEVCKNGAGIEFSEELAKKVLTPDEVIMDVSLGSGDYGAEAYGCDLTYDYVKINGDYRT